MIAFRCAEGNVIHIPVEEFQEIERILSQEGDRVPEESEFDKNLNPSNRTKKSNTCT
ncbi:hypothetical protein NIES2135_15130 [Leptolyngbya boryana NIES-2135]|jgi:hypothetical protein|uniref:Uncharacterized protein n=1 Tax=Leptolyngbya boryana NIES-2135 TaxID=1973484 RepID=A0A1Z4JD14_LEPBY|nr:MULTISPECIES: hypothetical protein [Leptolyngbya]BAY54695.1 hypothetical protein NIES2135_15130 [Leptolyngbya boryana NIES-2135]MBD2365683.1 hypothetical protein [Leptolyngbya sp. FACHB-161]MBD2371863.1 hypothetical protein [Leptolyngbya sp. FACHB-238]MBD2396288.1 hypothetical protein [Leptolyngbya sp. FACHB-239]MBD2402810.1 hypothetical protein [Leptolyngbya sp. FACHB-402]